MVRTRLNRRLPTIAMVSVALVVGLVAAPTASAAGPPAVSHLRAVAVKDHSLEITYDVPATYYASGTGLVARITRGYTPAASPTTGYPASDYYYQKRVLSDPHGFLTADTVYTFAIWLHTGGGYSPRATISLRTTIDTTPPASPDAMTAAPRLDGLGRARVLLTWPTPTDDDIVQAAISVNTRNTPVGAPTYYTTGTAAWIDDNLPAIVFRNSRDGTSGYTRAPVYYFVKLRDRAGHWSRSTTPAYTAVGTRTVRGHAAHAGTRISVTCCPSPIDGSTPSVASVVEPAGDFELYLPPNVYDVSGGTTATSYPADLRITETTPVLQFT